MNINEELKFYYSIGELYGNGLDILRKKNQNISVVISLDMFLNFKVEMIKPNMQNCHAK